MLKLSTYTSASAARLTGRKFPNVPFPKQLPSLPSLQSLCSPPALPRTRRGFTQISAALAVQPLQCQLSTTAKFPLLNFFLLLLLFSQALFCLLLFSSFPSFMLTVPASAHSSSISQNRAFTLCLSPASAERDWWVP